MKPRGKRLRIYEYPCEVCGEMMTATRRDKRFCSPSCMKKDQYRRNKGAAREAARANRPCGYCGKPFTPKRSDAVHCSPECRGKGYYRETREIQRERGRAWVEANPEKRQAALARFGERHPDYGKERYARLKADPDRYAAERERGHLFYLEHRDEALERARRQRERWPTKSYTYKVGCDWDELFARFWHAQEGKCYLCGDPLDRSKYRGIHLDHDHACCGPVRSCEKCRRGLACPHCNTLIGWARDDPDRLRRIADNLEAANALVRKRRDEAETA